MKKASPPSGSLNRRGLLKGVVETAALVSVFPHRNWKVNGLCLALVKSYGQASQIQVRAISPALQAARVSITIAGHTAGERR
jgi:hypothetical protein